MVRLKDLVVVVVGLLYSTKAVTIDLLSEWEGIYRDPNIAGTEQDTALPLQAEHPISGSITITESMMPWILQSSLRQNYNEHVPRANGMKFKLGQPRLIGSFPFDRITDYFRNNSQINESNPLKTVEISNNDLSNDLDSDSPHEITAFIRNLPKSVSSLDLSLNQFRGKLKWDSLPENLERLAVDYKNIDWSQQFSPRVYPYGLRRVRVFLHTNRSVIPRESEEDEIIVKNDELSDFHCAGLPTTVQYLHIIESSLFKRRTFRMRQRKEELKNRQSGLIGIETENGESNAECSEESDQSQCTTDPKMNGDGDSNEQNEKTEAEWQESRIKKAKEIMQDESLNQGSSKVKWKEISRCKTKHLIRLRTMYLARSSYTSIETLKPKAELYLNDKVVKKVVEDKDEWINKHQGTPEVKIEFK